MERRAILMTTHAAAGPECVPRPTLPAAPRTPPAAPSPQPDRPRDARPCVSKPREPAYRHLAGCFGRYARTSVLPLLLAAPSCSRQPPASSLDPGKVASIVVGRSSRNDVFAALGQPARTDRSSLGEVWIYQPTGGGTSGSGLMSGASAASGILGAFVPYAGAVGSGLGLAGTALDGTRSTPPANSLSVAFRDDGIVRDCTFSITIFPAAGPAQDGSPGKVVDCQRPDRTAAAPP